MSSQVLILAVNDGTLIRELAKSDCTELPGAEQSDPWGERFPYG